MWTEKQILELDTTPEEKARFAEQAFLMSQGKGLKDAVREGNQRASEKKFESALAKKILGL